MKQLNCSIMLCHYTSVLNCAWPQSYLNKLGNLHGTDAVINEKVMNHCMFDHTTVLQKKWNRKESVWREQNMQGVSVVLVCCRGSVSLPWHVLLDKEFLWHFITAKIREMIMWSFHRNADDQTLTYREHFHCCFAVRNIASLNGS